MSTITNVQDPEQQAKRAREAASARLKRAANPEKAREASRRYYATHPEYAERAREASKLYRTANPEEKREGGKRYRAENPEKVREAYKRWAAANPEKVHEFRRRWNAANLEKKRAQGKRWVAENPEKAREMNREKAKRWQAANPERVRINNTRRRAAKRGAPGTYSDGDIATMMVNQGGLCWWCTKAELSNGYHVDHVVPLSRGGSNAPDNLVLACPLCNRKKHASLPEEWCGRLL